MLPLSQSYPGRNLFEILGEYVQMKSEQLAKAEAVRQLCGVAARPDGKGWHPGLAEQTLTVRIYGSASYTAS